jgi:integrase
MAIREASPLGHDATLPAGGDRCAPWACRETGPPELPKPRLLDPRPPGLGSRHYIRRTEKAYVHWIKRYVFLLGKRYPAEVGATEVTAFLTSLAVQGQGGSLHPEPDPERLALSLSRRAGRQLPWLNDVVRAKRLVHLAVVLTHEEVRAVLQRLDGVPRLVAILLYGVALRLLEYCRLRVKDVDFATNQITIRHGKGHEDRVTMLSAAVKADLSSHLERVRRQHEGDLRHGADWVELPSALLRKYPYAGRTWEWQWVFPAIRFSVFPRRTIAAHAGCAGPIRACMFPMRSS